MQTYRSRRHSLSFLGVYELTLPNTSTKLIQNAVISLCDGNFFYRKSELFHKICLNDYEHQLLAVAILVCEISVYGSEWWFTIKRSPAVVFRNWLSMLCKMPSKFLKQLRCKMYLKITEQINQYIVIDNIYSYFSAVAIQHQCGEYI